MTIYYLYVKTHTVTGLKYLGQTKSNPFSYLGSGITWVEHLKEHGKHINTEILKECKTKKELKYWGKYYSNLWNVVKSAEWANRVIEAGAGGWWLYGDKNPQKRPDVRLKTSEGMKKYLALHPKTDEQKKKHSEWNKHYWTEERKKLHKNKSSDTGKGMVSVTDLNGISKRITKEDYDKVDRNLPPEQQFFVSVSSKESKRRREIHLRTVEITGEEAAAAMQFIRHRLQK